MKITLRGINETKYGKFIPYFQCDNYDDLNE